MVDPSSNDKSEVDKREILRSFQGRVPGKLSSLWDRTRSIRVFAYYRVYMRLLCWYSGLSDKKYIKHTGQTRIPPAALRYRVGGRPGIELFLSIGKSNSEEIESALKKIGRDLNSFENVLDFGCGCGRTLIWFVNKKPKFYGTDIDSDAINWCRQNLAFGEFTLNSKLPPLEHSDDSFDFIYSISVFTHLNKDHQFQWLSELKRVLRPNGILIITVHDGKEKWEDLSSEEITELQGNGFLFKITNDKKGIFPNWYQTAYHTKDYVLDTFSKYFEILEYIERGVNNFQDLVVLQKKT